MRQLIAALLTLFVASSALAQDPRTCSIPGYLLLSDNELGQVGKAVKKGRLVVSVVGSGSSLLSGPDGPRAAYPARLEATLAKRLPGIAVKVITVAKGRETAEDMAKSLRLLVAEQKPDLVIWQTGTVDAMRGVPPDDFKAVLEDGIEKLKAGGADVILMNQQYSPRTESMIAIGPYADTMRVVAQHFGAPLFDRLSIMRHWSEVGQFDLHAASRNNVLAQRVHDCIGRAIASLVIESARLQSVEAKTTQ